MARRLTTMARPRCLFCGAPATEVFAAVRRCRRCASTAVDAPHDLRVPTERVTRALARGGARLRSGVTVQLRTSDLVQAFTGATSPERHVLGLTRGRVDATGAVTSITITVVAGLPDVLFRTVFAHELGHAMMLEHGIVTAEPLLAEGMAEFFSYAYLNRRQASSAERRQARRIATNPDPVYGGGFRRVRAAVGVHGFAAVFAALQANRLHAAGLS